MEASSAAEPSKEGVEFFEKHIRPVLAEQVLQVPLRQAEKVKGKLLLDTARGPAQGGRERRRGRARQPGEEPADRLAVSYTDEDLQMPPKEQLPEARQCGSRAVGEDRRPDPRGATPRRPRSTSRTTERSRSSSGRSSRSASRPLPAVKDAGRVENADRPLHPGEARGEGPARRRPPADRRTLIRRRDLRPDRPAADARGGRRVPGDDSPDAFEKVVDRLLASPAYGERWGRHWLDLVRYADTLRLQRATSRSRTPTVPRLGDRALQRGQAVRPVRPRADRRRPAARDRHRRRQPRRSSRPATSPTRRRFGSRASEFHLTIDDTIDNLGKAMLGLSRRAAPAATTTSSTRSRTTDYYALYGIFNSTQYSFPGTEIYRHPKDLVAARDAGGVREAAGVRAAGDGAGQPLRAAHARDEDRAEDPPKAKDVVADAKDGKDAKDSKDSKDARRSRRPPTR